MRALSTSPGAEDDMVRGVFINRADSHQMPLKVALDRYLSADTLTKRASTAIREKRRGEIQTLVLEEVDPSAASLTSGFTTCDTRPCRGLSKAAWAIRRRLRSRATSPCR
jgi:hypothetical protein